MCEFFSCIVHKNGNVYFCETDSHEDILAYMKQRGLTTYDGRKGHMIVRLEMDDGILSHVNVDQDSMPEWYERSSAKYNRMALKIRKQVRRLRNRLDGASTKGHFETDGGSVGKTDFRTEGIDEPHVQQFFEKMSKIKGYVGRIPMVALHKHKVASKPKKKKAKSHKKK